ncbi:hypothetical protein IB277_09240 [Ensifer sp. ENS07]|uniref:hypothetical protein n=1 Tax=Ensifer sp. ENS07 TaxID=2769274 RepID=UPI00177DB569|nr:hypothetical protein [Ensifer sp. ENS07]MBD9636482.1 hypothetical protein [Ensifer sp. ENS07]
MTVKPEKDPKTGRFLSRAGGGGAAPRARTRKAVRTKLGELFLEDMLSAWESRGAAAIHALIEKNPNDFLKTIAALMPKDVTINPNQMGEMTDGDAERAPMRVAFEKPVYASGFTLTGYIQRRVNVAGDIKLRWGFQTPVNASRIESTAEGRTGSVRVSGKGWLLDLETDETGYTPSPDLEFDEGFLGCTTLLASGVEPPKSGDLFLK